MVAEGLAMRPGPRPRLDDGLLALLRGAIKTGRVVAFDYVARATGQRNRRRVQPYGVIYGNRAFLVGHTDRGPDLHLWRLANIIGLEVTQEGFTRDPTFDLQQFARRSFGTFQEEPVPVALRFAAEVAQDVDHFVFHPDQSITRNPDGSLTVRFTAGGLDEICWHLVTWGTHASIERPAHLRQRMQAMCAAPRRPPRHLICCWRSVEATALTTRWKVHTVPRDDCFRFAQAPQRTVDLHRPAAMGHDCRARQFPHQYAQHRPPGGGGHRLHQRVLPEPDLHSESRQLPDRLLPEHRARLQQRQRALGRGGAAGDETAGGRRLLLRAGGEAAPGRSRRPHRAAPAGRRLHGVPLEPRSARQVARGARLPRLGGGARQTPWPHLRRARLPPAGTAPDHLLRRPGDRVPGARLAPALADERQHLRPARAVRPAPGVPGAVRSGLAAASRLPPERPGGAGEADRRGLPNQGAGTPRPSTPSTRSPPTTR